MEYTKGDAVELRSILLEAEEVVNGPRAIHYGPPTVNFQRIAALWNAWLEGRAGEGEPLDGYDVAYMMVGAWLEVSTARALGMSVRPVADWIARLDEPRAA